MWDIDRLICKRVVSGSEIVVIFVGEKEEKRPFFVHKDLIALHSRYFRDHFHSSPLSPPDSEEEKKLFSLNTKLQFPPTSIPGSTLVTFCMLGAP
jgi:hypothetical protein